MTDIAHLVTQADEIDESTALTNNNCQTYSEQTRHLPSSNCLHSAHSQESPNQVPWCPEGQFCRIPKRHLDSIDNISQVLQDGVVILWRNGSETVDVQRGVALDKFMKVAEPLFEKSGPDMLALLKSEAETLCGVIDDMSKNMLSNEDNPDLRIITPGSVWN